LKPHNIVDGRLEDQWEVEEVDLVMVVVDKAMDVVVVVAVAGAVDQTENATTVDDRGTMPETVGHLEEERLLILSRIVEVTTATLFLDR